jgi:hypothetical protein
MRPATSVPAKKTSNFQNLNQNQFHKPPSTGPKQISASHFLVFFVFNDLLFFACALYSASTRGNLLVFSRNGPKPSGAKIAGIAAAPTPLNTPSLKSENSGKDILVNLVPVGSSGAVWTSEGKPEAASAPTTVQPSEKPVTSRPAPWASRSGEEGSAPPPAPMSTSTPPARSLKTMKNWADDDSDSDTEDIARAPPQQPQQQQMSYPGHADPQPQYAPPSRYGAAPPASNGPYGQEPSRWQRGGPSGDFNRGGDDYYRGTRPSDEVSEGGKNKQLCSSCIIVVCDCCSFSPMAAAGAALPATAWTDTTPDTGTAGAGRNTSGSRTRGAGPRATTDTRGATRCGVPAT